MRTRYHVAISVNIDKIPDELLIRDYADIGSPNMIRQMCVAARERGWEVFPPCDNVGANGRCLGHPIEPELTPFETCSRLDEVLL